MPTATVALVDRLLTVLTDFTSQEIGCQTVGMGVIIYAGNRLQPLAPAVVEVPYSLLLEVC